MTTATFPQPLFPNPAFIAEANDLVGFDCAASPRSDAPALIAPFGMSEQTVTATVAAAMSLRLTQAIPA